MCELKVKFDRAVKKRFVAIMLAVTVLSACGISTVDNKDAERARDIPKIEYVYLSSEETHPFLKGAEDYSPSVVKKYPTVRSCLIPSEQKTNTPDLRLIDWDRVRTRAELKVCLWRIFSSLKYPEPVLEWLDFHKAISPVLDKGVFDFYPRSKFTNQKFNFTLDDTKRHNLPENYVVSFGWKKAIPFRDKQPSRTAYIFSIGVLFDGPEQNFGRVGCGWQRSF